MPAYRVRKIAVQPLFFLWGVSKIEQHLERVAMSTVAKVQKKVQDILSSEFGSVRVSSDGSIKIPYESTMVNIEVEEWLNGQSIVVLTAVIARDSKSNSAVYEWVNTQNANLRMGTVYHLPSKTNNITVMSYALLGDFMDPDELTNALRVLVLMADKLDDEFVSLFGGERFVD